MTGQNTGTPIFMGRKSRKFMNVFPTWLDITNALKFCAIATFLPPLAACSIEDDFGRLHRPEMYNRVGDIVGSIQEHTGIMSDRVAYHIPLSNDEHQLRRTLAHFRAPFLYAPKLRDPLGRQRFSQHRTGQSFVAYMQHSIKSDIQAIHHFNHSIGVVIEQDMQRYSVLASTMEVTENDGRFIRTRIRENRAVTISVFRLLDRRMSDYDQAIEYARLQYPERELLVLRPDMQRLRAKHAMVKAKYERYIFQRAAKHEFEPIDSYPPMHR